MCRAGATIFSSSCVAFAPQNQLHVRVLILAYRVDNRTPPSHIRWARGHLRRPGSGPMNTRTFFANILGHKPAADRPSSGSKYVRKDDSEKSDTLSAAINPF